MPIVIALCVSLLLLGVIEKLLHQKNLQTIPLRIHVNGTRGKSSTTLLIAGALREAGYKVVAKTTGTTPLITLTDGEVIPIVRKRPVTILEQLKVVRLVASQGAEVLVVECMGVNPEVQWISEKHLIQSQIGIITNVRADHLDEMGTNLTEIAETLARTIPKQGVLITAEKDQLPLLQTLAAQKSTKVYQVDPDSITKEELSLFQHTVFPENVALALQVSAYLGLGHNEALQGMRKVEPDPGAFKIWKLQQGSKTFYLINALAANDVSSTHAAWQIWQEQMPNETISIGLYNNRADRGFRIPEMAQFCQERNFEQLLITGELRHLAQQKFKTLGITSRKLKQGLGHFDPRGFLEELSEQIKHSEIAIFAFGNIKGNGWIILEHFERNGEELEYVDLTHHSHRYGN